MVTDSQAWVSPSHNPSQHLQHNVNQGQQREMRGWKRTQGRRRVGLRSGAQRMNEGEEEGQGEEKGAWETLV